MQTNNEQFEKFSSNMFQAATDTNTLVRDTVKAWLQSISIMTKGCGDLCDTCSSMTQKYLDQSVKISQSMMSTTNVNDLVNTQSTALKSSLETLVSDMSNITQLSTRIAQQAVEPVATQVNNSISKISKTKAA